ncbi:MAG TPA: PDZ domain-containing protein [Acidimicrobiales bacterium]
MVAALCLLTTGVLYRPPLVIVAPGPAVDVTGDVSVDGVPVTPITGRFLVPTVEVRRTNALGTLVAAVRDGRRVVPAGEAGDVGGGRHPGQARETRILAAAAAALSQGLPATVTGTGATVVAVRRGSPAAGTLRPGDVVLAVDGRPVSQAALLSDIVRAAPTSTALTFSVERDGQVVDVIVTTAESGVGITVETRDLAVELPFEVRFSGRSAGGPGAGLAYALAIADLLSTNDVARGRTIAAHGTVDADGHVGPAGDPATAADASAAAGASILVVPVEEVDGARRDGLTVEGVENLARALEVLATTV